MTRPRFDWTQADGAVWTAKIGDLTLVAAPDRYKGVKPARGTKWHAAVNHWDERTRTISRFGRDVYSDLQPTAQAAKRLAEQVYLEATVKTR